MMKYYCYILRCADDSLYCGVTNDLDKRLREHNLGLSRSAKYTRAKRPVVLVYHESFADRGAALRREYAIKKLSKTKKESLISAFSSLG